MRLLLTWIDQLRRTTPEQLPAFCAAAKSVLLNGNTMRPAVLVPSGNSTIDWPLPSVPAMARIWLRQCVPVRSTKSVLARRARMPITVKGVPEQEIC